MVTVQETSFNPPKLLKLRSGAIGIVYQVNSLIVVKCPTIEGREDFLKENAVFNTLTKHPPCPEIVTSFLRTDDGNFLEYMQGFSLTERLQRHQIRDPRTTLVLSVLRLEPRPLRMTWMKALAKGTAWLESIGLAHGDLKPENILISEDDHVKIADFDCTNTIGQDIEVCTAPYARIFGSEAGLEKGHAGKLGARSEQFALGSLFYYINYGTEVYDNDDLGTPQNEHGPAIVELLQRMIFPKIGTDSEIDPIIDDCWHGRFPTISALSESISEKCQLRDYYSEAMSTENFAERQTYCLQLVQNGILEMTR